LTDPPCRFTEKPYRRLVRPPYGKAMKLPRALQFGVAGAVIGFAEPIGAQTASHELIGTVFSAAGAPVPRAEVFLLESLDATVADDSGRFGLRTRAMGRVTVVARHVGFAPSTVEVPVDTGAPIAMVLRPRAATLAPISVQAGAYTAGSEHGMTLTALEVVTTPGATADLARAIQTLPGVHNVDEGTGLFVRGGDVNETKVLLNDAVMLSPYNY
jgi:vitamin B12 transporter